MTWQITCRHSLGLPFVLPIVLATNSLVFPFPSFFRLGSIIPVAPTVVVALKWEAQGLPKQQAMKRLKTDHESVSPAGFRWSASLDRRTALASSFETSWMPTLTFTHRHGRCVNAEDNRSKDCNIGRRSGRNGCSTRNEARSKSAKEECKQFLTKVARTIFSSYPMWLCRPSVSFGLLRVVPSGGVCSSMTNATITIQDVFTRSDLLTFGAMRPLQNVDHRKEKCDLCDKCNHCVASFEYPIIGGLLAYSARPPINCTSTGCNKKKSQRTTVQSEDAFGYIRFTLDAEDGYKSMKEISSRKMKNGRRGPSVSSRSWSSYSNNEDVFTLSNFRLESSLIDYMPSIAGPPPVLWIRKILYRSTQSLVHADVMWKYHRWCRRELRKLQRSHKLG